MRTLLFFFVFFISITLRAQQSAENIIVITTDGFRWQDVFKGMDSAIANNPKYNQGDSAIIFKNYWSDNENERRKKLFPFLWSTFATKGQVFGNRTYGNKVDNANRYWFSYPGYNEILTGYPDTAVNSNAYMANPNTTVFEYLNKQAKFKGRVAAFGAWDAFDRIFNKERCGFPVVSAFTPCGGANPTADERLINAMLKDSYRPFNDEECLDVFTHYEAMDWLKTKKPKVLYISYGETDEWAHAGQYRSYLDAAHHVDEWISRIWNFVQNDPQYKNKTTIFLTVDHGRGDINKDEWTSHYDQIKDSHEIWFAVMGPNIAPKGEIKTPGQIYQQQFAKTFAKLLGSDFQASHPVAEEIKSLFK